MRATRLTLRNTGSTPLMAQVRIYAWSQEHGEDRLHDTDQLVASPPIVELAAGEEHLVRVVRVGPAATGSDQAYRAVVDELPGDQSAEVSQVALRMRYVIPIHDRAAGAAAAGLQCRIDAAPARLHCANPGGRAAQLGASRLLWDDGQELPLSSGLYGYVLPGAWRTWPLPDGYEPALAAPSLQLETWLNGQVRTLPIKHTP
ncbi:MAG: fimbria/pilus periplasmic chaperone [Xanthomonadales bacterium]|nr:fimbria/pilus periplasmic chaperone [Xanthomonadales bacterium]